MNQDLQNKGIEKEKKVTNEPMMLSFSQMNKQVFNPNGDHLGQIEDVILDLTSQRIAFGVLTFGGIFGLGEKHYAIPWKMLDYEEAGEKFILDISKEKLTNSENIQPDKNNATQPNSQPTPYYGPWANSIYQYYGYDPYWFI